MTLPSSGVMRASMINAELGRAGSAPFDINGSAERTLAQVPSGIIKFSDFYGKSAGDPFWANVTLLLTCDGANGSSTFTDLSSPANTMTVGAVAARVSTAQAKWGQSANFTGGANSWMKAANINQDFNISKAKWTFEAQAYQTAGAGAIFGITNNVPDTNGIRLYAGSLQGYSSVGGVQTFLTWAAPSNNAWHHFAVVRDAPNLTVYVDGVQVGTISVTSLTWLAGQPLCLGISSNTNQEPFTGFLDEIRWTSDVARYSANFTPPTAPFPVG